MSGRVMTLLAAAALGVALAGCRDSGLPDRNLPIDQAAHRPPDALVQAVHPQHRARDAAEAAHAAAGVPADAAHGMPADATHGMAAGATPGMGTGAAMGPASRPIRVGEQTFLPGGTRVRMDAAALQTVGSVGGMSFSAARGATPPFDRLYMSHPGGAYITYLPVHDESGDPHARLEALKRGLEAGPGATAH